MKKLISIKSDESGEFYRKTLNNYLFLVFIFTVNFTVISQKLSKAEIINGLYNGKFQFSNLDSKWKKDIDVAFNAVFIDGLNLKYVNSKLKTNNDFIQSAIWSNGYAINYVDKNTLKNIDSVRDIFDDSEIELLLDKYGKKYVEKTNWHPMSIFISRHMKTVDIFSSLREEILDQAGFESTEIKNLFPSKEIIIKDTSSILYSFNILPYDFQKDTNIIFNVLEFDVNVYGILDKKILNELLSNRNLILQGIKRNEDVLNYVDSNLKSDREFILSAVQLNGKSLEYVNQPFKKDREIVLKAINQNGLAIMYADESLKGDKEVVLEAVKKSGYYFQFASVELKKNKPFVIEAIKVCNEPFWMDIDNSLLEDEDIKILLNKQ